MPESRIKDREKMMKFFSKAKEPFFLNESIEGSFDDIDYDALVKWKLDKTNLKSSVIESFHGSAFSDQLNFVKQGVAAKIPLNIINEQGYSLLTIAARGGATSTTLYLIDELKLNPAFYDISNNMRHNALHAASAGGHFAIVKMLLEQAPMKLSIDMPEPFYHLSPLQTAISENQFDCAENIIANLNPDLHYTDKRGRTPLATLFCCYVNAEFDTLKTDPKKIAQLEKLCLELLATENAFNSHDSESKPAFLVLNTCELALEVPSGTPLTKRIDVDSLLISMMVVAPKLAVALLKQAQSNPSGSLESEFISLYNHCIPKLRQETDKGLRSQM